MIFLAIIAGAAFAWLAYAFATAPEGYEDAEGFHLGRERFEPPHEGGSL